MARTGNHGIIVPRDPELLRRLYWVENRTLPEIAAMYGVNHKSVLSVFRALKIPTRAKGTKPDRGCIVCGARVHRIRHAVNGAEYGRRCKKHWDEHRAWLAAEEAKTPQGAERKKRLFDRWYYEGPLNPQGELQWISKSKALLRRARRALNNPATLEASPSRSAASRLGRNSRG